MVKKVKTKFIKRSKWSGRPELWVNEKTNTLVIRAGELFFEKFSLDKKSKTYFWERGAFKPAFSFDFYKSGTTHLRQHNFKLIEKL